MSSDYSPGLLDDLMTKGKNAKTAELLSNILQPVAKTVGAGALAGLGWKLAKQS
jgi:hypothetical protein